MLDWDSAAVLMILGAPYVGRMEDLAVFDRVLSDAEVKQLYGLIDGVKQLYAPASLQIK